MAVNVGFLRRLLLYVVCAIAGCSARQVDAQFLGYTSPQTVAKTIWAAGTDCSGGDLQSAAVPNVGQSVNTITYAVSLGVTTNPFPQVWMEGSNEGAVWHQISTTGFGASGVVTGFGAYPFLRLRVFGGSTGCTISAGYSGTSVAPGTLQGEGDFSSHRKYIIAAAPANAGFNSGNFLTPYGNTGGLLSVSSAGVPSGSSLAVLIQSPAGSFTTIGSFTLSTQSGVQLFQIPSLPSAAVQVQYTSGGASANALAISYDFFELGAFQQPLGEKTVVINTAAAGPTRILTAAAATGITSFRITSINLSSGTAEAIDLQQGTGTNCGTGNSQLTGLTRLAVNTPWIQTFAGGGLISQPGNDVCIHLSAANQTDGTITYSQY